MTVIALHRAAPRRSSAEAAKAVVRTHLDARTFAGRTSSIRDVEVPATLTTEEDVLALAALAVAQTFGFLDDARDRSVLALVRNALEGSADDALERCEPDTVLTWCTVMNEWCERNGLDHAFSRLQPLAAIADADAAASIRARVHWRIAAAWHQEAFGRRGEVAALLDQAEAMASHSAQLDLQIPVWLHQARLAVSRTAPDRALALARRVAEHADERTSPLWLADASDVMARAALMRGDMHRALHQSRRAVALADAAGVTPNYAMTYRLYESYALLGMGSHDEALALVKELAAIPLPVFLAERLRLLARMYALVRDDRRGRWPARSQVELEAVTRRLRELDWPGVLALLPAAAARLWSRALDTGIEIDWICASIKSRDLLPLEMSWPEAWPWSIRISVLGPFSCVVDGSPVGIGARGKAAAKPMALLRRLAAEGAHQSLPADELGRALWPGQGREGRGKALETTLARLRRVIGRPDAIIVSDRRLQLNAARVWIDTVAIERHLDRLRSRTRVADPTMDRARNWERALALWRGPLLAGEPAAPWIEALRERMRRRLAAALHDDRRYPGHHARRLRALAADPELERLL